MTTILNGGAPVLSEAQLNAAIAAADGETSGAYRIQIAGIVPLTTVLDAINLHSGVTLDIAGGGGALDGGGAQRGLFVYSGAVTVENLTLQNMVARGGSGGSMGGGGAGLGGGLFVADDTVNHAAPGQVTLTNVIFASDSALGGGGGGGDSGGGGGGLGGNGGDMTGGGGGGIGGAGGAGSVSGSGAVGIVLHAGGGGSGQSGGGGGGASGGGGGGSSSHGAGGGGGGVGGVKSTGGNGGAGGFGGGGGGASVFDGPDGGPGGFGGGGGGKFFGAGGKGGFGGGGGGGAAGGAGGFGAGVGGSIEGTGGGGGGLGAGGDIFVQPGASLTIAGGDLSGGSANGGAGGGNGASGGTGYGGGIFLQGNETLTLDPARGTTLTISGIIADMTGSHDASGQTGVGSLNIHGTGAVALSATNTYTGLTAIQEGTLYLQDGSIAGGASLAAKTFLEGFGTVGGAVNNLGTIEATAGDLVLNGAVTGAATPTGLLEVTAGATLTMGSSAGVAGQKTFGFLRGVTTGVLKLEGSAAVLDADNPIANFAIGDTIDVANIVATGARLVSGKLDLTNGATTLAALPMTGSFAGKVFITASDGGTGTDITLMAAPASASKFVEAIASQTGAAGAGGSSPPYEHLAPGWGNAAFALVQRPIMT